jgi:hypothetical protein
MLIFSLYIGNVQYRARINAGSEAMLDKSRIGPRKRTDGVALLENPF